MGAPPSSPLLVVLKAINASFDYGKRLIAENASWAESNKYPNIRLHYL